MAFPENATPCTQNTIHQVTTMLATPKNVIFLGHNHLLTTSADDHSLAGARVIFKVLGRQHRWSAGGYDLKIGYFLEVDSMVANRWTGNNQCWLPHTLIITRALASEASLVPVVSRWLWPGNRTFLEVASMVVTCWLVAFLQSAICHWWCICFACDTLIDAQLCSQEAQ